MAVKTWSYRQITAAAEVSIRISTDLAREAQTRHPELAQAHLLHARGVLFGWENLVMGWIKPGDRERLEALLRVTPVNPDPPSGKLSTSEQ